MEFALKWMYSVDAELEMPYQDNLQSLMNAEDYRQIIGSDLWKRMDYIRRTGNNVAHSNKRLGKDEAMLCLENLFIYLDYIAYCYSDQYEERFFDRNIILSRIEKAKEAKVSAKVVREELAKEQQKNAEKERELVKEQEKNAKKELELVKEQQKSAKQELDLQKLLAENASLRED